MEDFDNPEVGQLLTAEAPTAPKPEPFENSEVNALVDPEWQHRQLERKRQEYAGQDQSLLKRAVLSSVPFVSAIGQTLSNQHYGAAKEKFDHGTANDQDIEIMAEWERRHQEEGDRSLGGKIGSALMGVPAIAGEAMATPFSLPVRGAGGFILNKAVQAQLMPSMTLQHASARAAEQGGSAFDPQNLAPAAAFSAVQNMVLGSLGHVAGGVANPAARFLAKTAAGVGEMQGANVLAGAVDEILPEAYQTKTRYGAIGSFLRGEAGEGFKQLAVDTVTMAAFTALHGNPGLAKEMVAETADSLDAKAKAGEPREAAAAAVREEARRAQLKIGDTEVLTPQSKDLNPAERYAVDKYGENKVLRVGLNGPDGPMGSATLAEEGDTIHVAWVGKTGLAGGEGRGKNLFGAREVFSLATQLAEAMPDAKFLKYTVSEGRIGEGKAKIVDLDAIRRRGPPATRTETQLTRNEPQLTQNEPIKWKQKIQPDEPPVAEGMIRMYHGGILEGEGTRWLTPDRAYAEGYAAKNPEGKQVGYVDLPRNSPLLKKAYDDTGTSSPAPPVHFDAPEEIARQLKPLKAPTLKTSASGPRPEPVNASQPAPEAPGASNAKLSGIDFDRHPRVAMMKKAGETLRRFGWHDEFTRFWQQVNRDGAEKAVANAVAIGEEKGRPPEYRAAVELMGKAFDGWQEGTPPPDLPKPTMSADEARAWITLRGLAVPESDAAAIAKAEKLVAEAKAKGAVGVKRPTGEAPPEGTSGAESLAVRSPGGLEKAPTENLADSVEDAVGRMVEDMASGPYFAHEQSRIMSAWRTVRAAAAKSGGSFAEYADPQWVAEHVPRDAGQVNRAIATIVGYHRTLNQRYGGWEPPEGWDPTADTNGPRARGLTVSEETGVQNRAPALPAAPSDPLADAYRNKGITKRDQDIHRRLINGESGEAIAQSHRMTRSRVNQIKDEVDAKVGAGLTVEDRQQEMALERAQAARAQGRVRNTATSEQAQSEQAPVDESEPKADIGKLSGLIKEQFDEGNRLKTRWHVERMRQVLLDNWFTPEEVDAAFAGQKMPPKGKAPGEPTGGRVQGANAQRNAEAFDYYLKRAFMDALTPKEMADVKAASKDERVPDAEVRRRVAEAYDEAVKFADRQVASETAAGEGHTGDPGDFNPAELESPDPARVAALMKQGFNRSAAEERATLEAAKQQHPQQAMGAAALGELTHEAQAPEDPRLTALAHAQGDAEREALKLKPAPARGGYSQERVNAEAEAAIRADPQLPDKITAELEKKLRPLGAVETVVMERRKVLLNNELDRIRVLREAGDAIDQAEYRQQELDTLGKLERHMDLTDRAGSEAGGAFVLRQQLMAEDYSAVGMLRLATAAKGEALTPAEEKKIETIAGEIKTAIADEAKAAEVFIERAARPGEKATTAATSPEWKQLQEAKTALAAAKGTAATMIGELKPKTIGQRLTDILTKLRVNWVISGPKTLAKLFTASTGRLVTGPLEEAAGAVWSRLPGVAKIAALAPREGRGLSLGAEKQAQMSAWMEGLKDAWKTIRTGKSDLDVLHGGPKPPRSWLDWQFSLHDAIKAPAVRAEYTRSFLNRVDQAAKLGKDATSPAAILEFSLQAYKDSQAAKFRQENWLVDAVNKFLTPGPKSGPIEKFVKIGGRLTMPVLRIPTNLAFETANYVFGLPRGAVGALHARYVQGLEKLEPKQADAIMQQFKKGSLGAAALLIGAMNPQMFGGYYAGSREEEYKRRQGDVAAGAARIGGVDIPAFTQHIPFLQVFQIGATFRRAYDHVVAKDGKAGASVQAAWEAANGWLEEIPLTREANLASHLTDRNAKTRGYYFGELAKSLAIPQLFQWVAGEMDKPHAFSPSEDSVKRKPEGVIQHVEMGIPGLRQKVPAK